MDKKSILLSNGETYFYLEKGNGDKTLILIHGNLSSCVYYKPLLDKLPQDIKVYAIDLRGFGDSSYNKRIFSLGELANDVKLFMESLKIDKASILGWSLGGGVAMEFAAHYQESIDKLILMNSTTHKGYPIFKKDSSGKPLIGEVWLTHEEIATDPIQVKPVLDAINTKNSFFLEYLYNLAIYTVNKPTEEEAKEYISETLKQRNLVDVDYALSYLNMSNEKNFYREGDNTVHLIECPVLHIWGKNDIAVPEYMVLENIKAMKNSQYIRFDNCGHSPIIDKLDELTDRIVAFIGLRK